MNRRLILRVTLLALLAGVTNNADARNLFFNRQVSPPEALPTPGAPYQQGRLAPAQKMPYQAVQKMSYQAAQKGAYQQGAVAACVRYVQHCPHRSTCCGCSTSYQTVLTVIDPRTCCPIHVPVCVPSCCTGQPTCSGRNGLFGRGITNYKWCCGYTVRIVVGNHGDVIVHYYGV